MQVNQPRNITAHTENHWEPLFFLAVAKKLLVDKLILDCSVDCSIKKINIETSFVHLDTNIQNKSLIRIKILLLNASVRRFCCDRVNSERRFFLNKEVSMSSLALIMLSWLELKDTCQPYISMMNYNFCCCQNGFI